MKMTFRWRMMLLILLMGLVTVVTNVLSLYRMNGQRVSTAEIGDNWLPAVGKSSEIENGLANIRRLEMTAIVQQKSPEQIKAILDEIDSIVASITIYSKVLEPLLLNEKMTRAFEDFSKSWEQYQGEQEKYKAEIAKGNFSNAAEIILGSSWRSYKSASLAIKELTDVSYLGGVERAEDVKKSFRATIVALVSIVSILTLAGLIFGAWLLRRVSLTLEQVVSGLGKSAGVVAAGTKTVSDSSQSLSANASTTASNLQEIVASMEEIRATVSFNAQNASEAARQSKAGLVTVNDGEERIRSLITVMGEISKDSKKIEDIISLINDIAFQTNLLALNAAVEAARAGEQGRGFAVVADAVRALAGRSSEAAKEISALIAQSSSRTTEGGKLADQSKNSLVAIVQNVESVSKLIDQVAVASAEQEKGVNLVNQGLGGIDQSLQGVAHSMTSIAASTNDIETQSQVLTELMEKLTVFVGQKKNIIENNNNGEVVALRSHRHAA